MKKSYIFGALGVAVIFAFALVGFLGMPASAQSEAVGNVVVYEDDVITSTDTVGCGCGSQACTGSCDGNCDGTCGSETKVATCTLKQDGGCSAGSCGGTCGAAKTKTCGCQG